MSDPVKDGSEYSEEPIDDSKLQPKKKTTQIPNEPIKDLPLQPQKKTEPIRSEPTGESLVKPSERLVKPSEFKSHQPSVLDKIKDSHSKVPDFFASRSSKDGLVKVSDLLSDKAVVKTADKAVDKLSEKPVEKPGEKTAEKIGEKSAEKSKDSLVKVSDLLSDKPADKATSKAAEKPVSYVPPDLDEYTVVIDIGQGSTKVGLAGEPNPFVFETITGTPKYKNLMADVSGMVQSIYVGDDCTRMRGVLKIDHTISRGNVMNWDQYFAILNHIFYNILRVDPKKCNVLYIVPPLTPPETSQYYARVLFETHKCKTVAVLDSASASVFGTGETTALAVEIGAGLTHIVPVMNGQIYAPSIQRLNLAGMDVEEYMNSLMTQYGMFQKREILTTIKEEVCEIDLNPAVGARDSNRAKKYTLPDGDKITISPAVSLYAAEVLFNPQLLGYPVLPIQQAILNSLRFVDPYYWRPLLKRIVLSGGSSLFKGLKERLEMEVERLIPQLGPLPAPVEEKIPELKKMVEALKEVKKEEPEEKKMVQIKETGGKMENCPKCGELFNVGESKFCPFCGAEASLKQINMLGASKEKFPDKCPKCSAKSDGESKFCSKCGTQFQPVIIDEDIDKKEQKMIKKAAVSEKELNKLTKAVESEYGSEEDMKAMDKALGEMDKNKPASKDKNTPYVAPKPLNAVDPNKLVNVILSDAQKYGAFKGAAILGALPSFKKCLIDYATFSTNPYAITVDFSKFINPQ